MARTNPCASDGSPRACPTRIGKTAAASRSKRVVLGVRIAFLDGVDRLRRIELEDL
jgi:hypothetical protein